MFGKLFNFKDEKDFLSKELEDFGQMLSLGEQIYRQAVTRLTAQELPGLKTRDELYQADQRINKLERKIRKRIVSHLNFNSNENLPTALILMSVVKDAERIGDYGKNIFEISDLMTNCFSEDYFNKWFKSLDDQLLDLFAKTKKCFLESDTELAREIMEIDRDVVKMCDQGLKSLAASDVTTNVAVSATLTYRYFKRIGAHLSNIATSVIMPISDLDYYDERKLEKK